MTSAAHLLYHRHYWIHLHVVSTSDEMTRRTDSWNKQHFVPRSTSMKNSRNMLRRYSYLHGRSRRSSRLSTDTGRGCHSSMSDTNIWLYIVSHQTQLTLTDVFLRKRTYYCVAPRLEQPSATEQDSCARHLPRAHI